MRWLHISDIHYSPDMDGRVTTELRERLPYYIQHLNVKVDEVFVTGDFRNASHQDDTDSVAEESVAFVRELATKVGINDSKHIHIVPGNHDLRKFKNIRQTNKLNRIRGTYDSENGRFAPDDVAWLLGRFSFFKLISSKMHPIDPVWTDDLKSIHTYRCFNGYNLLYMNTAIIYNNDSDRGHLIIGNDDLSKTLKAINEENPHKPIIALAHHPLDLLSRDEQRVVTQLFTQHHVKLYLCGDEHKIWHCQINRTIEIVMGCIKSGNGVEATFSIGEFGADGHVSINAHLWNGGWGPYPQFDQEFNETRSVDEMERVKNIYYEYLKNECTFPMSGYSYIDNDVLLKATALEKLFIPLRFFPKKLEDPIGSPGISSIFPQFGYKDGYYGYSYPIPKEGLFRTVIFSGPGGGKTTWMRRLISAYAHGNFDGFDENLPKIKLFPILIKCRDIRDGSKLGIFEIIENILDRASIKLDLKQKQVFIDLACQHIREGTSVILIDGIDEIINESTRQEFIRHIKEFADNNKNANIAMSSRRTGFENISEKLFSDFQYWEIQPFSEEDIECFCIGWHKIFSSSTEKNIEIANELFKAIINDEKILLLAKKPVLLHMLLLISKRYGNQLPARRVEIYKEAVNMLLERWNQEGFPRIELRDAFPLMAYLAHYMMFVNGIQRTIDKDELIRVLDSALVEMPQYILNEEVNQFIARVEERSELLVRISNSDKLEKEKYEFQHPTFQEYLAAVAVVHKKYSNAKHRKSISDCFNNLWEVRAMQEVIIFTTTIGDIEDVQDIIRSLLDELSKVKNTRCVEYTSRIKYLVDLLLQIIAYEAELTPIDCNNILKSCFASSVYSSLIDANFWLAYESKRYKELIYKALMQIDEARFTPIFSPLLKLRQLSQIDGFSILRYYFEEKNKGNIFDTINLLSIETWLYWQNEFPKNKQSLKFLLDFNNIQNINNFFEDFEILKNDLIGFCMGSDMKLSKIAFQVLYYLCKNEDETFSAALLQKLLKVFDVYPFIAYYTDKFPINHDTLLILQGSPMSDSQRLMLQEKMTQEMNPDNVLRYFIFGILCGAWNVEIIIEKAKEFYSVDYFTKENLLVLFKKIRKYFSVLQDSLSLNESEKKLVEGYLNEYKPIIKDSELYTWDNIDELLREQEENSANNSRSSNNE